MGVFLRAVDCLMPLHHEKPYFDSYPFSMSELDFRMQFLFGFCWVVHPLLRSVCTFTYSFGCRNTSQGCVDAKAPTHTSPDVGASLATISTLLRKLFKLVLYSINVWYNIENFRGLAFGCRNSLIFHSRSSCLHVGCRRPQTLFSRQHPKLNIPLMCSSAVPVELVVQHHLHIYKVAIAQFFYVYDSPDNI